MPRLALTLAPAATESPTSYLSRLAARNHCESLMSFCLDVGIDLPALSTGAMETVTEVTKLAGLPADSFDATTVIKSSTMRYRVGAEAMDTQTLSRGEIRVCPECIREDLEAGSDIWAAIHRLHWQIPQIMRCVRHGDLLLTHRPEGQGYHRLDTTGFIRAAFGDCDGSGDCAATFGEADDIDRYLTARIYGEHKASWCDNLEIPALCKASVALGTLLGHGKNAYSSRLDLAAFRKAFLTGFRILDGGEAAITDALAEFTAISRKPRANQPSPQYGELQRLLGANGKHRQDLKSLRDVVRDYFIENYPIKSGTVVLGRKLPERRLHSLRSAYLEVGCRREILEDMLLSRGIGERDGAGRFRLDCPIPAEIVAELVAEKARYLNEAETADYIGASFNMFKQLHRSGLLQPRTGPNKRKHKGFDRFYLDDFLARIFQGTEPLEYPGFGMERVADATRKAKCSTPDVLRLILDRKIAAAGRLTEAYRLDGLLVQSDQVIEALRDQPHNGYPLVPVCRELFLDMRTVRYLIDTGILTARRRKCAVTRITNLLVTPQSLNRFRTTHGSLGKIQRHRSGLLRLQHSDLKAFGVEPAIAQTGVRRIYRWDDLPEDLVERLAERRQTKGYGASE